MVSPGVEAKANRMVDRLRQQHALGKAALHAEKRGKSTGEFAARHAYSEHTMRKMKAFARHFSQADLDELCRRRRPNGLPIHWGFIPYLLAIESKHGVVTRKRFQNLAISEGWSVPRLNREIRERLGVSGHGRAVDVPDDLEDGLQRLAEDLELFGRRCEKLKEMAKAKRKKSIYARCLRLSRTLAAAKRAIGTHSEDRRAD